MFACLLCFFVPFFLRILPSFVPSYVVCRMPSRRSGPVSFYASFSCLLFHLRLGPHPHPPPHPHPCSILGCSSTLPLPHPCVLACCNRVSLKLNVTKNKNAHILRKQEALSRRNPADLRRMAAESIPMYTAMLKQCRSISLASGEWPHQDRAFIQNITQCFHGLCTRLSLFGASHQMCIFAGSVYLQFSGQCGDAATNADATGHVAVATPVVWYLQNSNWLPHLHNACRRHVAQNNSPFLYAVRFSPFSRRFSFLGDGGIRFRAEKLVTHCNLAKKGGKEYRRKGGTKQNTQPISIADACRRLHVSRSTSYNLIPTAKAPF